MARIHTNPFMQDKEIADKIQEAMKPLILLIQQATEENKLLFNIQVRIAKCSTIDIEDEWHVFDYPTIEIEAMRRI